MRKAFSVLAVLLPVVALVLAGFATAGAAEAAPLPCTPTGFVRDSINLTAALINPTHVVSGQVDATGCNIGVYYDATFGGKGRVVEANIFGANYFGVVNNGAHVDISRSRIHDIGETPLNGDQHGVAIYFAYGSTASGDIVDNRVWNYQKGGIVVNGSGSSAKVSGNIVLGQGPVNYIAQNGIQIGYGAKASVTHNVVTGNSYTGDGLTASGGIIVVGGACYGGDPTVGTQILDNVVTGNDIGIWLSNLDANCAPVTTPTKVVVAGNLSENNAVNNTSGQGVVGQGYQAGIADQGDGDRITGNRICGVGYTPVLNPPPYLYMIDVTVTNNVFVHGNTSCDKDHDPDTDSGVPGHGYHLSRDDH